jgi:hypothetical protein
MPLKSLAVTIAISVASITATASAISFTSHDLYPLANPGGGFTQVFPTGFHPAADGVVGGQGAHGDNFSHAFLWKSSANPIDLNPAGFTNSYIYAADATHQVGFAANNPTGLGRAFLWSGTAASAVDLTPAGYSLAVAYASSTTRQVGSVAGTPNNFIDHAVIWSGTAASFVDINPAGYVTSQAINLDATHQVGSGTLTGSSSAHALLWTDGSPVVDLHPAELVSSQAQAVRDGREVGFGNLSAGGDPQALLWQGATNVATNLTPAGFGGAIAEDANATSVVGFTSSFSGPTHAAWWSDSAASFIDLHTLLGPGFVNSQAFSIAADGTIYGTALASNNVYHAVSWTPIQTEPLAGDYNGNGTVDAADYILWRQQLNQSGNNLSADGDHNGTVNALDYDVWRSHFGQQSAGAGVGTGIGATVSIPEPTACAMLVLGIALLTTRRSF